eukprot:jgi/Undpi1/3052/HiC_scaffold_15.g06428.m1
MVRISTGSRLNSKQAQAPSSERSPSAEGSTTENVKRRKGLGGEPPASTAAKDAAKHLGLGMGALGRRVPVTVCIDVVLMKDLFGKLSVIEPALKALALLNEVASVYLISWVESDEEEKRVKDMALSCGLISTTNSAALSADANPTGIPEHRLLFCSSHVGQVAIIRQLTPSLHVGGLIPLLEGIYRFVPSLVRIDPSAVESPPNATPTSELTMAQGGRKPSGGGGLEWREFKSLAAASSVGMASLPPRDGRSRRLRVSQ